MSFSGLTSANNSAMISHQQHYAQGRAPTIAESVGIPVILPRFLSAPVVELSSGVSIPSPCTVAQQLDPTGDGALKKCSRASEHRISSQNYTRRVMAALPGARVISVVVLHHSTRARVV